MKIQSFVVAMLISGCITPSFASSVGVFYTQVPAAERESKLDVVVWYPAVGSGEPILVGENGLFYGAPATPDAAIAQGKHPLVLISHGGGGNGAQFGWLANALVARGFVVAAPNHSGSTSGNASAQEMVKVWLRASDLSATLDGLNSDVRLVSSLDMQRVGVFGFSAGGYSALAVAGARVNQHALTTFCDDDSKVMSDCDFLRRGGVDLHQIDLSPVGRSNLDSRVGAVVAVDPGIAPTLTPESLTQITVPVALINMGTAAKVPYEIDASDMAKVIKEVVFSRVEGGNHFSLLPDCKPGAPYILEAEGEIDPLCDDVEGGRSRFDIHQQLAEEIGDFFMEALPSTGSKTR